MPQVDTYLKKQAGNLISDQQQHISLSSIFQTIICHDQKSRLMQQMAALNRNGLVASPITPTSGGSTSRGVSSPALTSLPPTGQWATCSGSCVYQRHPPLDSTEPHRHRPPAAGLRCNQKYACRAAHCADYGQEVPVICQQQREGSVSANNWTSVQTISQATNSFQIGAKRLKVQPKQP
ncbi:hypothetical protein PANDA_009055 [Ailuropoda melanoleuca]|uniref:Uncharacterized protein n=1 Tax=Ailuropoda melanoleuca TaxID=9646 RepID=D2HE59_AILME|nr:hypothetical protein PANDA_009055 [Ailuropoda melanoleuca]